MTVADAPFVPDYLELLSLKGKGVVVLGAGQGIGHQVSHALAQAGAELICVDVDAQRAESVARQTKAFACCADVTTRVGMEQVFAIAAARLKQPHGIVDIVGRALISPIEAMDDDAYQRQHDIVFRHAWLALQAGAPWLAAAGGGSIVLVGSVSAIRTFPGQALYGAYKAALHQLAAGAAVEYGPLGVRVNSVAPGTTRTARLMDLMGDSWDALEATIPLRRAAMPSDIASVVLFLASDMARHITAQTIVVDGGATSTIMRPPFPNAPESPEGSR